MSHLLSLRILAIVVLLTWQLPLWAEPNSSPDSLISRISTRLQRIVDFVKPQDYQPSFSHQSPLDGREYIVGIHPLHNPKRLFEIYGPIVDYIKSQMPDATFKLEASRNYSEFERKLYNRHFDFAMPNPYQTIQALPYGYRVFGKMADDADFRGIILVRKDSDIETVDDLKGKAIAYPAATALAATMMPQLYLQRHGLDISRDIDNRYVGSQESSIMNVLLGHVAAAATWPVPWKTFVAEHPEQAAELDVKWQTDPLINNSWIVRDDVPEHLINRFAYHLLHLQDHAAGRALLQAVPISRFEAANDQSYDVVIRFVDDFQRSVREIK